MKYVVVDIGGTDIKYGLAERSGVLLHSGKMPSCLTTGGAASLAWRWRRQASSIRTAVLLRGQEVICPVMLGCL